MPMLFVVDLVTVPPRWRRTIVAMDSMLKMIFAYQLMSFFGVTLYKMYIGD
jgi:hypothetical protein